MAKKKKENKLKLNKWIKILTILLSLVATLIFIASNTTKEITFNECGTSLPNYKYSLRFPFFWTVKQTMIDVSSSYYEVSGPNNVFTVSCTNQGVGGDVCDDKYRTKFMVNGNNYEACFGEVDDKWNMGVLNLSTDPSTNATVAFWSEGLEKKEIDKILSTFKLKPDKDNVTKQSINNNYQYSMNYKYGVTYVDPVYGVKIEFPEGINSYKYKEYKWPSHEHVYNSVFDKTFATANNKFDYYTGNFYLNYDNPQSLGDLISYRVYDITNCNDSEFCQKYVNTHETSGITKNESKPFSFWMRSEKYVIMFGILGEDIKSANSKYKLSVQ